MALAVCSCHKTRLFFFFPLQNQAIMCTSACVLRPPPLTHYYFINGWCVTKIWKISTVSLVTSHTVPTLCHNISTVPACPGSDSYVCYYVVNHKLLGNLFKDASKFNLEILHKLPIWCRKVFITPSFTRHYSLVMVIHLFWMYLCNYCGGCIFLFFFIFVNNEFWSINDTKLILLRGFICPILSQSQIRPLTSCFDRKS